MAFKQLPLPFVIPKKLQFRPVTLIDFSYIEYRFVCSERYLCILLSQSLSKYWKGVIFSALGGGELNFSHLKEVSNKAGSFFLHLYTHFTLFLFAYALLLLSGCSDFILHSHFCLQSGRHFQLDCSCSHLLQVRPPL